MYTQQACFAFDFMKNYFIVRQFLIMTNYIHNSGCCFFESHSPSVPSWLSLFWTPHSPYEPSSPSVGWSVVGRFLKGRKLHLPVPSAHLFTWQVSLQWLTGQPDTCGRRDNRSPNIQRVSTNFRLEPIVPSARLWSREKSGRWGEENMAWTSKQPHS